MLNPDNTIADHVGDVVKMQNSMPPTKRQLELLGFMADYHATYGKWPSQREIAKAMGVNSSNMSGYIQQLVGKSLVRKTTAKHRNAELTSNGWQVIRTTEQQQRLI